MAATKGVRRTLSAMPAKLGVTFSKKYRGLGQGNTSVRATGGKPTRKGR